MERRLIIVRHTQTDDNVQEVLSGQSDPNVNGTGRGQATKVAIRIARQGSILKVVGSDLTRTVHVGEKICIQAGLRYVQDRRFRELDLGELNGRRRKDFPPKYRGDQFRTSLPTFDFTPAGGENAQQVVNRYVDGLMGMERYFRGHSGRVGRLVLVGHGTALRLVFKDHFGLIDKLHEQGDFQEIPWPL